MLESSSNTSTTTTTTTVNHSNVKRNNKENQTISDDAMTIPITSLANNQNSLVNSVIQQTNNQQSVIQSAGGSTSVQLPKSIILYNKINQNSVIQSIVQNTENEILQNNRMEQTDNDGSNVIACSTAEDESKRRREMLNRRPSYRKIYNDISSADKGILDEVQNNNNSDQRTNESQSHSSSASTTNTSSQHIVASNSDAVLSLAQPTVNLSTNSTTVTNSHTDQNNNDTLHIGSSYIKMIPNAMQLPGDQDLLPTTVHLSNQPNSTPHQQVNHGIVQYASSNPEPQFIFSDSLHWPYRVNSDFSAYQLRDPTSSPVMINSNNVSNASSFQSSGSNNAQHRSEEEQDKKRQLRLQKNREAAKECRRKKKEYIKCLEDRVNILSQQNKTLIEELKTLKKLYCQQNE